MKINELTKEQRERIEKYEVGKELLNSRVRREESVSGQRPTDGKHADNPCENPNSARRNIIKEINRTIKRIEDEIEFLENLICVEFQFSINSENHKSFQHPEQRLEKLKQELEDYKLMEKLE